MQKRKWADEAIAWANGAQIQCRDNPNHKWFDIDYPAFYNYREYRIKPEPKTDTVLFMRAEPCRLDPELTSWQDTRDNVKFTFDGETGKLKFVEKV